ncbi:MAG: hypothetical protein R2876_03870 [Eubacteriales bacterium]
MKNDTFNKKSKKPIGNHKNAALANNEGKKHISNLPGQKPYTDC